jgi:hypothetical protein
MNTTRFIEATTLVSIGALCAAAILTLTVPAKHATANEVAQARTETVTIVAKRMTAAEKNEALKAQRASI